MMKEAKQKGDLKEKFAAFPKNHPNVPLVISIIALIVAIVKPIVEKMI